MLTIIVNLNLGRWCCLTILIAWKWFVWHQITWEMLTISPVDTRYFLVPSLDTISPVDIFWYQVWAITSNFRCPNQHHSHFPQVILTMWCWPSSSISIGGNVSRVLFWSFEPCVVWLSLPGTNIKYGDRALGIWSQLLTLVWKNCALNVAYFITNLGNQLKLPIKAPPFNSTPNHHPSIIAIFITLHSSPLTTTIPHHHHSSPPPCLTASPITHYQNEHPTSPSCRGPNGSKFDLKMWPRSMFTDQII